MAGHKGDARDRGGRARRPHHISSIAHLFFDDDDGASGGDRSGRRELTICGPGSGRLVAWVCAGLVRALAAEQVILAESPRLAWSATSYLEDLSLVPLAGQGGDSRFWQVNAQAPPPGSVQNAAGPEPGNGSSWVIARNAGSLGNERLGTLEAAHLASQMLGRGFSGGDLLVWCLTMREAISLGAIHTLGRVLALLDPGQVEILVMEQGPDSTPVKDRETLELLGRKRVSAVAGQRPFSFHFMTSDPAADAGSSASSFHGIAQRIMSLPG